MINLFERKNPRRNAALRDESGLKRTEEANSSLESNTTFKDNTYKRCSTNPMTHLLEICSSASKENQLP